MKDMLRVASRFKPFLSLLVVFTFLFVIIVLLKNNPKSPLSPSNNVKFLNLQKLSPEVQVDYFINLLGKPVYVNLLTEKQYVYLEKRYKDVPVKEYVFVDEAYYIQAVTDNNEKVISYAITSRNNNFNPTFKKGGLFEVSLNKTTFSDFAPESTNRACYRFLGAHTPQNYYEEVFFGNPGHYLTYLIGVSNIAWSNKSIPDYDEPLPEKFNPEKNFPGWNGKVDCNKISDDYRKSASPNTFIVWSTEVLKDEKGSPQMAFFGPKYTQVRTLNE